MMKATATLLYDANAILGESPRWDTRTRTLYWVDIEGKRLFRMRSDETVETAYAGVKVGCFAFTEGDFLLLATEHGFAKFSFETETLSFIVDPEHNCGDDVRFNDGACDPRGRFWAGTVSLSRTEGCAALYRLDSDYAMHRQLEGLTNSNGIVFTPDARLMYHIDTPTKSVVAYDYDADEGAITNPRVAIETPPDMGSPDGMALDSEGNLWIAFFRGACVAAWNPHTGTMVGRIDVPAPNVTACAFGGDALEDLFITTARKGMGEDAFATYPHAGAVFRVRPGVRGVAPFRFAGR